MLVNPCKCRFLMKNLIVTYGTIKVFVIYYIWCDWRISRLINRCTTYLSPSDSHSCWCQRPLFQSYISRFSWSSFVSNSWITQRTYYLSPAYSIRACPIEFDGVTSSVTQRTSNFWHFDITPKISCYSCIAHSFTCIDLNKQAGRILEVYCHIS